jgi:hypothetical protein
MKATALTLAVMCIPAILAAQQQAASTTVNVPANYSAQAKKTIETAFQAARAKNLPDQPLRERLADGQAKNASDTTVAAAIQQVENRLEATQAALVRAGRAKQQPEEIASGAQAVESGATFSHLEQLAKHATPDRSLAVPFTVFGKLVSRGEPAEKVLAMIQSKLDAHASDDELSALASGTDSHTGSATPAAVVKPPVGAKRP